MPGLLSILQKLYFWFLDFLQCFHQKLVSLITEIFMILLAIETAHENSVVKKPIFILFKQIFLCIFFFLSKRETIRITGKIS